MKNKGYEFLKFSLDRISQQTFRNFEIVISDHSSDEVIKNLCNEYPDINIKYYKNSEKIGNSSANINNCITKASGEWIKILFQ
ncbi:MAG: glycosyltransferase family 2 protein, partial [bacterium]